MPTTPFRTLVTVATAMGTMLFGATSAGADVPATTTTTTVPVAPTTTAAPAPMTTAPPAAITQILPAPTAPTTPAPAPAPETKILGAPQDAGTKIVGDAGKGATSTTSPGVTVPPVSLSPGQVADMLQNQVKSGANSTAALLAALKPLQDLGMTAAEAAALAMGPFPVQGLANWTDDFGDPRDGPPPHPHQGNDIFTQFDTPVRAPADGTVRYETGGLGGLAAYVTTADGTYFYMAHMDSFATDLSNGAAVKQGRVVGFAGDSGNAKGGAPHVHFEIHPGGGAAVNPKPIIDGWVAAALARVPDLIASFQPKGTDGTSGGTDGGIPQILVATGLTRRFSAPAPSVPTPARDAASDAFDRAVLGPLTPPALAPMFDRLRAD